MKKQESKFKGERTALKAEVKSAKAAEAKATEEKAVAEQVVGNANKKIIEMREEVLKLGKEREAMQKKLQNQLSEVRKDVDALRKQAEESGAEAAAAARRHGDSTEAMERAIEKAMETAEADKRKACAKVEEELMEGFKMSLEQGEMAMERAQVQQHRLPLPSPPPPFPPPPLSPPSLPQPLTALGLPLPLRRPSSNSN